MTSMNEDNMPDYDVEKEVDKTPEDWETKPKKKVVEGITPTIVEKKEKMCSCQLTARGE